MPMCDFNKVALQLFSEHFFIGASLEGYFRYV